MADADYEKVGAIAGLGGVGLVAPGTIAIGNVLRGCEFTGNEARYLVAFDADVGKHVIVEFGDAGVGLAAPGRTKDLLDEGELVLGERSRRHLLRAWNAAPRRCGRSRVGSRGSRASAHRVCGTSSARFARR